MGSQEEEEEEGGGGVKTIIEMRRRRSIQQWNVMACQNLYKCETFYYFKSKFAAVELTRVGRVPFATNVLVEKIICKGT